MKPFQCLLLFFVLPFLMNAQQFVQEGKINLAPPQISYDSNLFEDSMLVSIELRQPGTIIRYALNDSIINHNSKIYTAPIVIRKEGLLSAKAFHEEYLPSMTFRERFYKIKSFAYSPAIQCSPGPKAPYDTAGQVALLDMKKGTANFIKDKNWLGFQGDTVVAELVFPEPMTLSSLTFSFMENQKSWIFMPKRIEVWANDKRIAERELTEAAKQQQKSNAKAFIRLDLMNNNAQTYTLKMINLSGLPDWHPGAGNPPWLFIDEIFGK